MSDRKRMLAFAAGAIAVLLALEGIARIAEAGGPPVTRWYDAAAELKVAQMDEIGEVDVVFVGTSTAWQGLVPDEFTDRDPAGRSAYNAGLAGGVPVVMEPWILEVVVPRLKPDLVVWGLTSTDFSAAYGSENLAVYREAPATRSGWLAALERGASSISALTRYRSVLTDPGALFGERGDEMRDARSHAEDTLGARGERLDFERNVGPRREAEIAARLRGYAIDPEDVAAVERTVRALEAKGIEVLLVEMPVPERYVALHPGGHDDLRRTHVAVRALAELPGVRSLDMRHGFIDQDFVDFTHLDHAAARRFTGYLAARIADPAAMADPGRGDDVALTAVRALAVNDTLYDYLRGPPIGQSELWWHTTHYGHTRNLHTRAVPRPEVLFIGDSMMLSAADAGAFTAATGIPSYNASLPRAGPELLELWLFDELFRLIEPDTVVWGMNWRRLVAGEDLSDCGEDLTAWAHASDLRDRTFAPVPGLEGHDHSSLALRVPPPHPSPIQAVFDDRYTAYGNRGPDERTIESDELAAWRSEIALERAAGDGFRACPLLLERYSSLIERLVGEGIEVVVVLVAQHTEDSGRWADGEMDAANALILELASRSGAVAGVDLSRSVSDDRFRDPVHVNSIGAADFTTALLEAYDW